MINFVCVLKSGGEFEPEHVYRMRDMANKFITVPFKFCCITDYPDLNCRTRPLQHDLQGWWCQLELFHPSTFTGQTFYTDLDVTLISNIDDMVSWIPRFAIAREYRGTNPTSTLMSFDQTGARLVWNSWLKCKKNINLDRNSPLSTVFFKPFTDYTFIQDKFPNRVCSFKKDWRKGTAPKGTSIVCYHGRPKPWDVEEIKPCTT